MVKMVMMVKKIPAHLILPVLLQLPVLTSAGKVRYSQACDHPIFCHPGEGSVLHTVQMARLFQVRLFFCGVMAEVGQK